MKIISIIASVFFSQIVLSQDKGISAFKFSCEQPVLPNTIVLETADTIPMPHSNCIMVHFYDAKHTLVMRSSICDTIYQFHGLHDKNIIGRRKDSFYDSTGRVDFHIESIRGKAEVCIRYYYDSSQRLSYQEGYRLGKPIRISYEYDQKGKMKRKTIKTLKGTG